MIKVMKLCLEPNIDICFWALLLMISSEDLILVFYIWILHTTIKVIMGKYSFLTNILLLLINVYTNYNYRVLVFFLVHFSMLNCPILILNVHFSCCHFIVYYWPCLVSCVKLYNWYAIQFLVRLVHNGTIVVRKTIGIISINFCCPFHSLILRWKFLTAPMDVL